KNKHTLPIHTKIIISAVIIATEITVTFTYFWVTVFSGFLFIYKEYPCATTDYCMPFDSK
ncbi:hypothetical protein ACAG13_26155, partial [Escherichia coli]|uniref:hypothetical protein n=1 Tax=Escherichia coli TaxID=562 RepID=UPI003F9F9501